MGGGGHLGISIALDTPPCFSSYTTLLQGSKSCFGVHRANNALMGSAQMGSPAIIAKGSSDSNMYTKHRQKNLSDTHTYRLFFWIFISP